MQQILSQIRAWFSQQALLVRVAVDGGIGATVVGCLLGVWFSGGDPVIIIGAVIFGFFVGLLGIATATNFSAKAKIIAAIALLTISIADGGFVYSHAHPHTSAPKENDQADQITPDTISLDCQPAKFPVLFPEGDLNEINLLDHQGQFVTFIERVGSRRAVARFGDLYRCRLTNLGQFAVTFVRLAFPVRGTTQKYLADIEIPSLEPNAGNAFVFFIQNCSHSVLVVTVPDSILAHKVGTVRSQTVDLAPAAIDSFGLGPSVKCSWWYDHANGPPSF